MPRWYAVAHPGLEATVAAELAELGLPGEALPGGVRFEGAPGTVLAALAWMRTPDRLLLERVEGRAAGFDQLTGLVRKGDWGTLLHPQARFEVAASTRASRLHVRDLVESRVYGAIQEARRRPFPVDRTARPTQVQRIQVRIDHDLATISIDAAGDLLHRRGWRLDPQRAPLRENLAAAVLRLAGWSPGEALVDPFCGSGTFAIEAALQAAGRPPHVRRTFAWTEWPAITLGSRPKERPRPPAVPTRILAADRDARTVDAAIGNARRAGIEVQFRHVDVDALEAPGPTGLVVANPPWGERLAKEAVASVYTRLGRALRERFPGWRAVFLAPDRSLAERVDRRATRLTHFPSGGTRVEVWALD